METLRQRCIIRETKCIGDTKRGERKWLKSTARSALEDAQFLSTCHGHSFGIDEFPPTILSVSGLSLL